MCLQQALADQEGTHVLPKQCVSASPEVGGRIGDGVAALTFVAAVRSIWGMRSLLRPVK